MQKWAERLLKKAETYERHHFLGHFQHLNGLQIASDLRDLAHKVIEKSIQK